VVIFSWLVTVAFHRLGIRVSPLTEAAFARADVSTYLGRESGVGLDLGPTRARMMVIGIISRSSPVQMAPRLGPSKKKLFKDEGPRGT